jgi:cation diffusion facilitator CzcD-associated flavoprotein CzcO
MMSGDNGRIVTPALELDVLIVGAGFAGLYHLHKLRSLGFDAKVFEAGSDLGGAWHWNRYPGARVDSEGFLYQYSNPDLWGDFSFTERFPGGDQLRSYFKHVDAKLDLSRDILFNKRVASARFDAAANRWTVQAQDGTIVRTKFISMCIGQSSAVHIPPNIKTTMAEFDGPIEHTAQWPEESIDWAGKRVAVVGTGSSGIQVIQEVAKTARELTVFQRTPPIAMPLKQKYFSDADLVEEKKSYPANFAAVRNRFGGSEYDPFGPTAHAVSEEERNAVFERLWDRGGFSFWLGGWDDVLTDEKVNRWYYDFWRKKTLARIKDPKVAEILAPAEPSYPFGTKRPCLERDFYEVFNQDNVELVDMQANPIDRITRDGIRNEDGTERPFDVIILATGFDAVTGNLTRIDFHGTADKTLKEKWADGSSTYLGVATHGFPNLFFMNGPQSLNVICGGPSCQERNGDWLAECLVYLRENDIARIEATPESEIAWDAETDALGAATLFPLANSWYMGTNIDGKKKKILFYAGGQVMYYARLQECAANGYDGFVLTPAASELSLTEVARASSHG